MHCMVLYWILVWKKKGVKHIFRIIRKFITNFVRYDNNGGVAIQDNVLVVA